MSFFQAFGLKIYCHRNMEAQKNAKNKAPFKYLFQSFQTMSGRKGYGVTSCILYSLPDRDANFLQPGNCFRLFPK